MRNTVTDFYAALAPLYHLVYDDWEASIDLRLHAAENDAVPSEQDSYGQKYEIRGRIQGPSGKAAALVAVRILLQGEEFPRFVTALP